jgi:hypothetical protein
MMKNSSSWNFPFSYPVRPTNFFGALCEIIPQLTKLVYNKIFENYWTTSEVTVM